MKEIISTELKVLKLLNFKLDFLFKDIIISRGKIMKKFLITAVLFLIFIQFGISEQIDNIVLLDTSESMFPYYSGTIDYLIEDIVQKQLQSGDTFHLLSFNDFPEYEISRTIRSEIEIKEVFNRILLLQPIVL